MNDPVHLSKDGVVLRNEGLWGVESGYGRKIRERMRSKTEPRAFELSG